VTQCAQKEAGSRSMVVACSEGGGVEVDGGSVTMTKRLWKRTVAAVCSGAGDEAVACSGAGIEDSRWLQRRSTF
jgi:hypothetical protein